MPKLKELNAIGCSIQSCLTLAAVGTTSRLWARVLNNTVVINGERLTELVENRDPKQPLITVANHYSCCDDPLLWGALPWRILSLKPYLLRWTLAAKEVLFTHPVYGKFFGWGRCVPVVRGHGVYQSAVEHCLDVLNNGGWVHVFPEGKVNLTQEVMRLKWGVGRLVADCRLAPIVLPMFHLGFDEILPNVTPYMPRVGKRVTVVIGDPIEGLDTKLAELKRKDASATEQRLALTNIIQDKMNQLRLITEKLHREHALA